MTALNGGVNTLCAIISPPRSTYRMSAAHHGNTPAAWTAVSVAMAGFVLGGIGLMLSPVSLPVFWAGVAFLPLALVVWQAMEKIGLGSTDRASTDPASADPGRADPARSGIEEL
jgi:hypothetical protein